MVGNCCFSRVVIGAVQNPVYIETVTANKKK